MKIFKAWILPAIIAGLLFFAVRPTLAQLTQQQADLALFLTTDNVDVGSEVVDGFSRIYYVFDGNKNYVSQEGLNSIQPHSVGEYIVYVTDIRGEGQIFLHHILSSQTTQLTFSSTNLDPKVSLDGWVVWEGWVHEEDGWQVFLFDGASTRQLTSGQLSMNPDIEGEVVVYARRDVSGVWRAVVYSKKEDKHVDVTTGESAREPKLVEGKIFLAQGKEEFALTAEDLLLLDLVPLSSGEEPTTVTQWDILDELTVPYATESSSTKEATDSGNLL